MIHRLQETVNWPGKEKSVRGIMLPLGVLSGLSNIPNSNQNHRALQILKTSYEELGYTDLVEDTEKLIALNPPPPNSGNTNGSFLQNIPVPNSLPLIIGGTILSGATN